MFPKSSSESLVASAPTPVTEVMPDPVVALEPEISLIEAPEPLPASSPVPAAAVTGDKLGEAKVKHWRKVGSGKGDEDDFFEVDISVSFFIMMAAVLSHLKLSWHLLICSALCLITTQYELQLMVIFFNELLTR